MFKQPEGARFSNLKLILHLSPLKFNGLRYLLWPLLTNVFFMDVRFNRQVALLNARWFFTKPSVQRMCRAIHGGDRSTSQIASVSKWRCRGRTRLLSVQKQVKENETKIRFFFLYYFKSVAVSMLVLRKF